MNSPDPTVKTVFQNACELTSPTERQAYLDQVCGDNSTLRQAVEQLLRAFDSADNDGFLLASPFADLEVSSADALPLTDDCQPGTADDGLEPLPGLECIGSRIGPYVLVEELQKGGMGAVYVADQESPVKKRVALKLIRADKFNSAMRARFQAEQQALTLMDHPNIARVFECGVTSTGVPYYAMQLVEGGLPLVRYCDEHRVPIRERLTLFQSVCEAIQHAHQKRIMHRDIKPSNVLVGVADGKPVAKVIDFGLAKAVDVEQPLTDNPEATQFGNVLGTWPYMSPEQTDPAEYKVDTRTDVYSLGAMLYELLTGVVPLVMGKVKTFRDIQEAINRIRTEEPPAPSARVTDRGQRKALRGELDWITLRALEKDPSRRYETASALAKDVGRYLADEPVEASPPSKAYRLKKFARKHWVALSTVAGVMGILVVSTVLLTLGLLREGRLRARATRSEKATQNLLNIEFAHRPYVSWRNRASLSDTQKKGQLNFLVAYQRVVNDLDDEPETLATRATAEYRIADLLLSLGKVAEAEVAYERVIALHEKLLETGEDVEKYTNELARCFLDFAYFMREQKKLPKAEAAYRRAIALHKQVAAMAPQAPAYQQEVADACNDLATLLRDNEALVPAEDFIREAIALGEQVVKAVPTYAPYRTTLAGNYHNLGNILRGQGKVQGSLEWYGKAVQLLTPIQPRSDQAKVYLRNAHWDRANALGQLGRHAEAIPDWKTAIEFADKDARVPLQLFLRTAEVEVALKATSTPSGETYYKAALLHAAATKAAADADETELKRDYGKRAMELLRQAKDAGYFRDAERVKQLKENKGLEKVLAEGGFQAFVAGLEAERKER